MSLCHYMVNIHSGAVTLMILGFCLQKNEKNYSNTVMISVLLTLSAVQMRLSEAETGSFFFLCVRMCKSSSCPVVCFYVQCVPLGCQSQVVVQESYIKPHKSVIHGVSKTKKLKNNFYRCLHDKA